MAMFGHKKRLWQRTLIVLLFAVALTGFRLLWIQAFTEGEQPRAVDGQLDLRDWDFSDSRSVTLDGEWTFHPYVLLMNEADVSQSVGVPLQVPGDWSSTLNPESDSPYGYGSYHLRVYVDPNIETTYSLRIPSIRSASELYANGLLVGGSGKIGENESVSVAKNIPYSSTSIYADETGVIDIVLQASNFIDPRTSGFVRSIKFGHEKDVLSETKLSTILQVATGVIFFVHALFACLLYVVGIRDKRLLYFATVIVMAALINLMGGDEKVLFDYIQPEYTVSFKVIAVVMIVFTWALVHFAGPQIEAISKKLLPIYSIYSVGAIIVILLLPMNLLVYASSFSFVNMFVAASIAIWAFLRDWKSINGGIWLALSLVALSSNYLWWGYALTTGLKVVYYPFDLIIAVICFAAVWFKHYHQMHVKSKSFALELQRADRVKDEFLANTSHELRNPLHSILNMSQAVLERERASLQEKSVRDLDIVLSVSRRMSVMVDELLDMTRLKEGSPQLQLQPVSLQAITAGVIDMLDFMIEGKPVRFSNEIVADFPLVVADENRLTQIVFNLLHNAVKFTNEGTITIQAQIEGDAAYFIVTDTGVGMDEETLQTIFDPYVQVLGEGVMAEGGLGLGLNISQQLVALHGATLQVQSTLGEGTTFRFSLSLAAPTARISNEEDMKLYMQLNVDEEAATTDAVQQVGEHEAIQTRILVVDDDAVNLQVIETILANENYDIETVLSGKEALSLLELKEFDLVISDVMMPQMSGYELTKRIRERLTLTELPILLLTARGQPIDIESGFFAGANDYVLKPVDALELRSRVRALADVKRTMYEKLSIEAAWLQAQIQPHFLFNTLTTIMALSTIDLERMRNVLAAFSGLLRSKFQFTNINELTPIQAEIELLKDYLLIEKERFQERLHVNIEIDDDVNVMIPSLTIQPLVENAVHHGLMRKEGGGQLTVRITSDEHYVAISIEDDGVGMAASKVAALLSEKDSLQSGIGVLNTNLRLKRRYGEGLKITSTLGKGTTVSFRVPKCQSPTRLGHYSDN